MARFELTTSCSQSTGLLKLAAEERRGVTPEHRVGAVADDQERQEQLEKELREMF